MVPELTERLRSALREVTRRPVRTVDAGLDVGLVLAGYDRRALGNDRVVDAVSCMQSGAIYGAAAQIDGLTARVEELLGQPVTAVVTGGLSGLVCPYCRRAVFRDEHLLLRGLHLIYRGIRGSAAGQT